MIECPWCQRQVEITKGRCPACNNCLADVTEADFEDDQPAFALDTTPFHNNQEHTTAMIMNRFKCSKCSHDECNVQEVAMTGTGLSKLFDIQHRHFLFVSCTHCGFVEIYNPNILNGKKSGQLGTIMDIIFGG